MRDQRARTFAVMVTAAILASFVPAVPVAAADAPLRRLPPADRDAIAAIFDPLLAPLGLVTTRAVLQRTDTYQPDPEGRHLAVYVEPTGSYTDAQFVENFMVVARVYLPKVFRRWKGLRSFDVCQEPLPGVDDREAPPPVTQLLVNRRTSKDIDWADATLADMIELANAKRDDSEPFTLFVDETLMDEPAYVAALADADVQSTSGAYQR